MLLNIHSSYTMETTVIENEERYSDEAYDTANEASAENESNKESDTTEDDNNNLLLLMTKLELKHIGLESRLNNLEKLCAKFEKEKSKVRKEKADQDVVMQKMLEIVLEQQGIQTQKIVKAESGKLLQEIKDYFDTITD